MSRTSRWPRVVKNPTVAPLRVRTVFSAVVDPCVMNASTSRSDTPDRSTLSMKPRAGSSGVVNVLVTRAVPVSVSSETRSVKVPPMSTPILQPRMVSAAPDTRPTLVPARHRRLC